MIRILDFPRLQLAVLTLVPMLFIVGWGRNPNWSIENTILFFICIIVLCWQLSHIVKYTPVWKKELPDETQGSDQSQLTVTVVNLQFENQEKEAVLHQLKSLSTNLLLLIEIDKSWSDVLSELEKEYPHRQGVVRENGIGIALWSKIPFTKSEVKHLVSEDRASIFARLRLEGQEVNFVGVHPTPPGLEIQDKYTESGRHDSRVRDAELMLVAKMIADRQEEKWIVSGDFNDVAWSHTTRLFKRMSGLSDPRVGRGLYNSYHAGNPILRFPIDQVFLSPGTKIVNLSRFRPTGSDHFAISTTFIMTPEVPSAPQANPIRNDEQDAAEIIEEGKQDAEALGED